MKKDIRDPTSGEVRRWNPAMLLTGLRFALAPVFAILVGWDPIGPPVSPWLALAVAILFEISDLADGYVARKTGSVTSLGKLLDPFADSVSRLTIFACMASRQVIGVGFFLVLMYRDSLVALTRTLCALKGIILSARISGKIKAWTQALTLLIILLTCAIRGSWESDPLFTLIMWATALVTVWSGIDYVSSHRSAFEV